MRRVNGILQTIGFKEFFDYLSASEKAVCNMMTGHSTGEQRHCDAINEEALDILKMEAIDRVKAATRHYAKRQMTWLKNRLIPEFRKWYGTNVLAL